MSYTAKNFAAEHPNARNYANQRLEYNASAARV
jgi:hypothetical protein